MVPRETASLAKALGLGRLAALLVVSVLGIAAFWHLAYGVNLLAAAIVVAEAAVLLAVAFLYAWRSAR
jgi:heme A synthase